MARKFERPPNFSGASEEDVVEFVQRYEQVAKYNGWNTKELNDNLEMEVSKRIGREMVEVPQSEADRLKGHYG